MKKCFFALLLAAFVLPLGAELRLAEGGETKYTIVYEKSGNKRLDAAVRDLAKTLKEITGAKFQVSAEASGPKIVIGKVAPGDTKKMAVREVRAKSVGEDLYIYGSGAQGNSDAIYGFLESELGCRWYTMRGDKYIPKKPVLVFDKVDYSHVPSFAAAAFYGGGLDSIRIAEAYFRRQRANNSSHAEFSPIGLGGHSLGRLIPPGIKGEGVGPNNVREAYELFKDRKYYFTNPEYFTMDAKGKRVIHQLCFSNPALRKELTRNIELVLEREYKGGDACIPVDLNDNGGVNSKGVNAVCLCPECRKLIAKYGDGVGPYYDYILELAEHMRKKYPRVKIKVLAYWLSQFPPPGVEKFPENVIVHMAPLYKNFLKPYNHPSNAPMLMTLREWCKKSSNFQIQLYPTVYPQYYLGNWPLVANIRQLAENLRVAKSIGVKRLAGECGFYPVFNVGLNDLRFYMLCQLAWDVTRDENAIAKEFFTRVYGKAAPLMIKYWEELEKCEAEETRFLQPFCDQRDTLTYLTPENLDRWEGYFDEMEKLAADSPKTLAKVRIARMTLDEAVVAVYYKYPENAKPDLEKIEKRWNAALEDETAPFRRGAAWLKGYRNMAMELHLGLARAKALPAEFLKRNAGCRIVRLLPARLVNHRFSKRRKNGWRRDEKAAFGIAFKSPKQLGNKSLEINPLGVYRGESIVLDNGGRTISVRPYNKQSIDPKTIIANGNEYHLYYLGRTMLWPNCRVILYNFVPSVYAPAGVAYDSKRPRAEFDIYVSLRYDPEERVLYCDQAVAVELPTDRKGMQEF